MSPTKVLLGQIAVVFGIVTLALMLATQWTAASLGYQAELGRPWTVLHGVPLYQPWQFFLWWFQFDAYAPDIFQRGAFVAASGGIAGALAAIIGSVWRARQAKLVTTYGSARWASPRDLKRSGLLNAAGVFLGRADEHYLRHDGPEHVMAFAPTRSGKGVGLVIPTLLSWTGSAVIHDIKGENFAVTAGWRQRFLALPLRQPDRPAFGRLQPVARSSSRRARSPRRPEHRGRAGRPRRRAREAQSLGEDQPLASGRDHPPCSLRRRGQDALRRRQLPVRPGSIRSSTRSS